MHHHDFWSTSSVSLNTFQDKEKNSVLCKLATKESVETTKPYYIAWILTSENKSQACIQGKYDKKRIRVKQTHYLYFAQFSCNFSPLLKFLQFFFEFNTFGVKFTLSFKICTFLQ